MYTAHIQNALSAAMPICLTNIMSHKRGGTNGSTAPHSFHGAKLAANKKWALCVPPQNARILTNLALVHTSVCVCVCVVIVHKSIIMLLLLHEQTTTTRQSFLLVVATAIITSGLLSISLFAWFLGQKVSRNDLLLVGISFFNENSCASSHTFCSECFAVAANKGGNYQCIYYSE